MTGYPKPLITLPFPSFFFFRWGHLGDALGLIQYLAYNKIFSLGDKKGGPRERREGPTIQPIGATLITPPGLKP